MIKILLTLNTVFIEVTYYTSCFWALFPKKCLAELASPLGFLTSAALFGRPTTITGAIGASTAAAATTTTTSTSGRHSTINNKHDYNDK